MNNGAEPYIDEHAENGIGTTQVINIWWTEFVSRHHSEKKLEFADQDEQSAPDILSRDKHDVVHNYYWAREIKKCRDDLKQ